jgi:hypothetical protein
VSTRRRANANPAHDRADVGREVPGVREHNRLGREVDPLVNWRNAVSSSDPGRVQVFARRADALDGDDLAAGRLRLINKAGASASPRRW